MTKDATLKYMYQQVKLKVITVYNNIIQLGCDTQDKQQNNQHQYDIGLYIQL